MTPGQEVRLKNAYIVKCTGCTKDAEGNIVEIQAEYDPISKSGLEGANRKVKGTLHWVSADHCHKAQVRVYDRLFCVENPSADERDFRELLNPESLKTRELLRRELRCRLQAGTVSAVPAHRLLHGRPRLYSREPRVQQDCGSEGRLGKAK